jgi:protein-L-isoaspartate(D-aspartate) O-methyltransferase
MRTFEAAERMVEEQLIGRGITDFAVLQAMTTIPRHMFVPSPIRAHAYEDRPLPIGFRQTISQPLMVGAMTQALALEGHERVLDVGTGSGYQAAVLSRLAREVYSVERVPALARRAQWVLRALGFDNVHVLVGDGSLGLPQHAPYDAIVVAAAAPRVPDELIAQLAPRGRLAIPVGDGEHQILRLIERTDGGIEMRDHGRCIFVPLVGDRGFPATG